MAADDSLLQRNFPQTIPDHGTAADADSSLQCNFPITDNDSLQPRGGHQPAYQATVQVMAVDDSSLQRNFPQIRSAELSIECCNYAQ